ncbi:tyrosinase family oxidase copper chaperone [Paractinoplanes atraurantiacus]|uniref:Tyrosinase co-factor MelC1 n=1 Tax=Paractinoplanes atraurantiacus TaxID=1036182 RepID=A0A285GQK8_9ACTN|nr:tyrosinase family oxidase copper chaperone [Actinoplanes atraurantiacus]SNY24766.1 Tyrosinase co-factor MelC1 [Actinoplanes atraurantiacus]
MTKANRRDVLRYGAAGAVTAATAAVAAPGLAGADPRAGLGEAAPVDPRDFDEAYKGKKIKGKHNPRGNDELHINNKKLAVTVVNTLFVPEDGSEPHVGVPQR